ncbi:hypothetical protein FHR70_002012 [Microvirga lupini]|uniref:Uncharacterized protein n=1 Tax=Microvirga lupini TaxID=420324 RepID=A0A7W4VKP5_9HYPH|nr:hypothetical protein [Microvirga lupini]
MRVSELSSSHVADHLSALTEKVDEIAQRAGVPAVARLDLETTLAALPWPSRRRLGLVLESARVGTSDKAVREAVAVMLAVAADVWARTPPPVENGRGGLQE